jgi:cellulose biosynthesis protein BcsQ
VELAVTVVGQEPVASGAISFLRDAAGVITAVERVALPADIRERLHRELAMMGSYVDAGSPLVSPDEVYDPSLASDDAYRNVSVVIETSRVSISLADRRIVGADWMSEPKAFDVGFPPIYTFASLKGGVGRSTALTIVANELALDGIRVLAIDLDLEAPGLGSLLLPPENRPKFGTLDFFVERGPSRFEGTDFLDMMEASPVIEGGAPVYVAPAIGTVSIANPQNVLGKLSRSYTEDLSAEGNMLTFLDRTRELIVGLTNARSFDVVLVDARAGLHETVAASVLGLGADVLLFGTHQPQTFEGYLPLFAHLSYALRDKNEILARLRMVHGKADLTNSAETEGFRDKAHSLFSRTLYGHPAQSLEEFQSGLPDWFNADDPDGPHYPWTIGESSAHRLFDPVGSPGQLDRVAYIDGFDGLLSNFRTSLAARLGYSNGSD